MTIERYLRLISGSFVLISLLLGYYYSPYWFLFTGFVAVNLIQSAFTKRKLLKPTRHSRPRPSIVISLFLKVR